LPLGTAEASITESSTAIGAKIHLFQRSVYGTMENDEETITGEVSPADPSRDY
jgi:hypothetical protein